MTDDSHFNISELKQSITSLYSISDVPRFDIIWTENNDVIDSFISEMLKYESSVIQSLTEKPYRPYYSHHILEETVVYFTQYVKKIREKSLV